MRSEGVKSQNRDTWSAFLKMAKALQRLLGRGGSEGGGGWGLPKGASLGMKLLGTAVAVGIGINQSMYTGEL